MRAFNIQWPFFTKGSLQKKVRVSVLFGAAALVHCSGKGSGQKETVFDAERERLCPRVASVELHDEAPYFGEKSGGEISFRDLREGVMASCKGCHLAPAASGAFTFIDSYRGEIRSIEGKTQFYPGFFEVAESIRDVLLSPDPKTQMPPSERRQKNEAYFVDLGHKMESWVRAGKPEGNFSVAGASPTPSGASGPRGSVKMSELGDCLPTPELVGMDYARDRFFERAVDLPRDLSDTDLDSLDAYALAQKGTLAYNVVYPLWADNNAKGRWLHLPWKIVDGKLVKQKFQWDPITRRISIPDNTRFYKSFYKKIKTAAGRTRYKRIETRLIVKRTPFSESLFGTYKWDESERTANLYASPYRDGTSFKDSLFDVVVDEEKKITGKYAIPGRHRCVECHTGSESQSFVLGFTPLQLNHREAGTGGRRDPISISERTQVERFLAYDIFDGAPEKQDWPRLEEAGSALPRNIFELEAQAYMVGNCYHCHNPKGIALLPETGVTLNLTPGNLFGFAATQRSTQIPSRFLAHSNGDLDQSQIWRKVSDDPKALGLTSPMPMSTPGAPHCDVLRVMGKWIRSFESEAAAVAWEPSCKKAPAFWWIDQDFTIVKSDVYIPKRPDWKDPEAGMTEKYRTLAPSASLQELLHSKIAIGYWNKKVTCQFPQTELAEADRRPWMLKPNGEPKRPFGEVFFATPGAHFYRASCVKCHGPKADGDTALARGILNWSGGGIRVANLIDGMFGNSTENLKNFDHDGKNLAPQYLIWMAMEGTKVQFPPELSGFLGKHGAQMLNQLREKCQNQISPEKPSGKNFFDHEVFEKICFTDNLYKGHPDLAYDGTTNLPLNPEKVKEWLDRAATNIGFAIFDFLNRAATGNWEVSNDQCELPFPKPVPQPQS